MTEQTADGIADHITDQAEGPTLPFWVDVVEDEDSGDGNAMGGLFRHGSDGETVLRSVPLGPLRKNLADTVDALQKVFEEVANRGGTLPLAEAQLSFQVTASGGIQLIGSGQIQGTRGLTLTFKRPS